MDAIRSISLKCRRRAVACAGAGLLLLAPAAFAQGSDDQYDLTISMAMGGMTMPGMTQRICVRKGASDSEYVPQRDNCRVSDTARSGSRLTFKMTCTGRDAMSGTGDFTFSPTGYEGQMRLRVEGQDIEMTQRIAARRSGGCTASK
jgi:hypothetical protein